MLIASQTVQLPLYFRLGKSLADQAIELLPSLQAQNILLLTGRKFSKDIANSIVAKCPPSLGLSLFEVGVASEDVVKEVGAHCKALGATALCSIGGGSVIDVGKRVHRVYGIPNIVFPTVISNDGLISPIAVLTGEGGRRESLPAAVPVGVVIDLDLIMRAPRPYLIAAAGDVLSNLSASYDWKRLFLDGIIRDEFNDLAYELAVGAAESLIDHKSVDFCSESFLSNVVRAQLYSGLAMSLAGTSRPCSGAEHLISHAIDYIGLAPDQLHGIQTGSISLFILFLLQHELARPVAFARAIGLPTNWACLSTAVENNIGLIFQTARRMRPERRTVLDSYTDEQLMAALSKFSSRVRGATPAL